MLYVWGRELVHTEAVATISEESHDLTGGSDAGVDVGFCGLSAHFLGGEEHTAGEFFFQFSSVVGLDVGHVFEVGACFQGACQSGFVNYFFAGGVNQKTVLGHEGDEVIAD